MFTISKRDYGHYDLFPSAKIPRFQNPQYVERRLTCKFPKLVSYNRFVELMPSILMPLCFFIHVQSKTQTGIYFVDATTLDVCHIKMASSNHVFKGIAKKGKSSMRWFFGFKLHLVINDLG